MCSVTFHKYGLIFNKKINLHRISPNTDDNGSTDEIGSGDGAGPEGRAMEICGDKITVPCDSEDFIMVRKKQDQNQNTNN